MNISPGMKKVAGKKNESGEESVPALVEDMAEGVEVWEQEVPSGLPTALCAQPCGYKDLCLVFSGAEVRALHSKCGKGHRGTRAVLGH